ncbi:MAG: aminotransferase class V-fold PLP-dependent enzyme [Eubacterium sp.]|nr:aminotransferase class V-fold PLP-dependent enzyme [Eubacterium sp.]
MAYFDNASTTFPKPTAVYDFMDEYYRKQGGSVGRGNYKMSLSSGELISETRLLIQELFHAGNKQVIFTPTATIALNIVIQGMIKELTKTKRKLNVYISPFEHNAVTRVLEYYKKLESINVYTLVVSSNYEYDLKRQNVAYSENAPDIIIMSHASNVSGLVSPVVEIFNQAKKYNAVTLLDMAQTAGLIDINLGLECIDAAVFAGHKTLYGPTGISGFVIKQNLKPEPVLFGGTGYDSANQDMPSDMPERYEMGTINISGVAGLNAALKWINNIGINQIYDEEQKKRTELLQLLKGYDYINLIGIDKDRDYVGIISCVLKGISSDSAGALFDRLGISVRTGLECAPLAHKFYNTYPSGTVRFSVSYFTEDNDFDELKNALDYIDGEL